MKFNIKTITAALLIGAAAIGASSCTKQMEESYPNPDKTEKAAVPFLFSNEILSGRNRLTYTQLFTAVRPMLGVYTQTMGFQNGTKRYEVAPSYAEMRWKEYYVNTLQTYREINFVFDSLPAREKNIQQIYVALSKVFFIHETAKVTDLWGDMPFFQAGMLRNFANPSMHAAYDSQESIYTWMLAELKKTADYLNEYKLPVGSESVVTEGLKKQDVIFKGDREKWKKFTNSLRLRLAMKVSYVKPVLAKAEIQEILGNPKLYPVMETNVDNALIVAVGPDLFAIDNQHEYGIRSMEGFNAAPFVIIDKIMQPQGDPRLSILYTKNKEGKYAGMPMDVSTETQANMLRDSLISRMDSATFTRNNFFPGVLMTASEVSFLKAEAAERLGIGGSAQTAYEEGIRQSINFYYDIRNISTFKDKVATPTAVAVEEFLKKEGVAYGTDNMNKICTQKWLHLNFVQAEENWAEVRRNKLPKLVFANDPSSTLQRNVPMRWNYPANERNYNAANYAAVAGKDRTDVKVWWDVKP
ncbi:SusD/RagB family nutrient-binding outer membrane lipoprotein [Chitinophaga nivalis]|uniref:SusD/RagB family nutrient-binding outer membrane lipoprotein n=1 Tax=Chitinophaga nivalis TaxID=2991709 RepID=A0ABT3IFS7_9BACT|nr:SusD/RagB family nutrient-binding outer membrane lipoprotein [Chitinophaga nivalis]MCW3467503.1 SusD/RagB family nutrient-binding outer membrane lipoprotein [Chitinophaga nivalis]MCW3482805.1 SusD/RagB family nutrient-binding outer membrane lipoprotein [Chitinophaga nivalis]